MATLEPVKILVNGIIVEVDLSGGRLEPPQSAKTRTSSGTLQICGLTGSWSGARVIAER